MNALKIGLALLSFFTLWVSLFAYYMASEAYTTAKQLQQKQEEKAYGKQEYGL